MMERETGECFLLECEVNMSAKQNEEKKNEKKNKENANDRQNKKKEIEEVIKREKGLKVEKDRLSRFKEKVSRCGGTLWCLPGEM